MSAARGGVQQLWSQAVCPGFSVSQLPRACSSRNTGTSHHGSYLPGWHKAITSTFVDTFLRTRQESFKFMESLPPPRCCPCLELCPPPHPRPGNSSSGLLLPIPSWYRLSYISKTYYSTESVVWATMVILSQKLCIGDLAWEGRTLADRHGSGLKYKLHAMLKHQQPLNGIVCLNDTILTLLMTAT
eukprot:6461333-Amphidinium_carterae.1